jgi:hypothetical protein
MCTLETGGEDEELHSKRGEKIRFTVVIIHCFMSFTLEVSVTVSVLYAETHSKRV